MFVSLTSHHRISILGVYKIHVGPVIGHEFVLEKEAGDIANLIVENKSIRETKETHAIGILNWLTNKEITMKMYITI